MGQSVSNVVARFFLQVYQDQGGAVVPLIAQSGISQHELQKPGGRLSAIQHQHFLAAIAPFQTWWTRAMLEDCDQHSLSAIDYSVFPEYTGACLNQPNGWDVIQVFIRYRNIVGSCDAITVSRNDSHTRIQYINEGPQTHYVSALSNFMTLFDLLRNTIPDIRVQIWLASARDGVDSAIEAFFGQCCHFSQPHNVLLLENSQLAQPSHYFNPLLHQSQMAALQHCYQQIPSPPTMASLVSDMIDSALALAPQGESSILAHICAELGISRWTLNDRLRPARTSFTELLKQRRLSLACRLLVESPLRIQQISDQVGFSSQAVFSRFFSSHQGMTPLAYRQRYGCLSRPCCSNQGTILRFDD